MPEEGAGNGIESFGEVDEAGMDGTAGGLRLLNDAGESEDAMDSAKPRAEPRLAWSAEGRGFKGGGETGS